MILNLLHRPERGQHRSLYKLQQEFAHRLKLKVTLMVSPQVLENEQLAEETLRYHQEFGDELALWLWSFQKPELGGSAPFWLLSREHKRKGFLYALELYRSRFGHDPISIGCYVLDAYSMAMIKEYCPSVTTVIAGCFEEGTKVYHGCNHSWFLFSEGVSWGPWYPAKGHSFRPAPDETDWSGLVAVPHLSRDLALAYEGRNDFFASHPANVQRGMANQGEVHEYDYNLIDQYRMQEDFNFGFSFYHVHVSASWLGDCPNVQDTPEVSQAIYREMLEYLAALRDRGEVQDMYMSEFGGWYKENVPIGLPMTAVGKEMLYGSGKHYFWYSDPDYRVLIDANQGGSIGDLRPYAGQFESFTGADSPHREIATYPYLIQSQLRTGTVNHFADGSRTTLFVSDGEEKLDLCYYSARIADVKRTRDTTIVSLTPVNLKFKSGLAATLETTYEFIGSGTIMIRRNLAAISDPEANLSICEYLKGCYGFTEYSEDMHGIELEVEGDRKETIAFDYAARSIRVNIGSEKRAIARIPQVNTQVSLEPAGLIPPLQAAAEEGHLFNPYYTLTLDYTLSQKNKEVVTCLCVRRLR